MTSRSEASRLHRRADPCSSRKAAEHIVASGKHVTQKEMVLDALSMRDGSTSAELAIAMGVDRYLVARRLPDLERDGVVVRGAERECKAHGGDAVTWWVSPSGGLKHAPADKRTQMEMFGGPR